MQQYKDYAPTSFDTKGLCKYSNMQNRQNWLVLPVILTRDATALQSSNTEIALKLLGGESDTVEVHRFNHWACGWFEIIIVQPDTDSHEIARQIESDLENYPILDDENYSEWELELGEVEIEETDI